MGEMCVDRFSQSASTNEQKPTKSHRIFKTNFAATQRCLCKSILLLWIISGLQITGLSLQPSVSATTPGPYLEPVKFNITVLVHQTAYMSCTVKNLGDKTVSWIRRRDLHILTSGPHMYTNDKRFSILRPGNISYTLKITMINIKDAGQYICEVNSEPPIKAVYTLSVLGSPEEDPGGALALGMLDSPYHQRDDHRSNYKGYEAKILGPSMVELEHGQIANFTCIITHGGTVPPNVTWFHNEIPVQKTRGGFSVNTEKSSYTTVSQLVINNVDKRDEGKYSCGGVTVFPDSIILKTRTHLNYDHLSNPSLMNAHSSASASSFPQTFTIKSNILSQITPVHICDDFLQLISAVCNIPMLLFLFISLRISVY